MGSSRIYKGEICLHFVGDIMLSRRVGQRIREIGPEFILSRVQDTLQKSDLLCGNLESPISENIAKTGLFGAPRASIEVIKSFDVVSLANNHIFDCGEEGIEDTIDILVENGVNFVGMGESEEEACKPAIFSIRGKKVAVFGCTTVDFFRHIPATKYRIPFIESKQLAPSIKGIRDEAHFIVLLFHGGDEFIPYPPPSVRDSLRNLVSDGVDLVAGHHPHVLGGYEKVEGDKLIWYSLGDFIFDSFVEHRRKSGILSVKAKKHSVCSFKLIPTYIEDSLEVKLADDKLSEAILEGIEANSQKLQELNYEKKFKVLYLRKFLKFQLDRLSAILKRKGFKPTIKFLLVHTKYLGYYISKFIKNKSA